MQQGHSLEILFDVDGAMYSLSDLRDAKRAEIVREREARKPAIRGTRIDADILASWSSGHTLLANNYDNHGSFALSFGELADKINEFFSDPPVYRVPKHKYAAPIFGGSMAAAAGYPPATDYRCTRCGKFELSESHESKEQQA